MKDLTAELVEQADQQESRQRLERAYRDDPKSVLTAAEEIEKLDRRTAARIAEILREAHKERVRLNSKLGGQRQQLQSALQRHLQEDEIADLDRLPRESSRDPRSYGYALIDRVVGEELKRLQDEASNADG